MGSGKTTIGRAVADRIGLPFADNDAALAHLTHLTAAEVQRRDGVAALHELEAQILRKHLDSATPSVIAAAASTIEDDEIRRIIDQRAFVIWLRAGVGTLADRVDRSTFRPLDDDAAGVLTAQGARRDAAFERVADVVIDTEHASIEDLADRIAELVLQDIDG
jgi:shikimate kinase